MTELERNLLLAMAALLDTRTWSEGYGEGDNFQKALRALKRDLESRRVLGK